MLAQDSVPFFSSSATDSCHSFPVSISLFTVWCCRWCWCVSLFHVPYCMRWLLLMRSLIVKRSMNAQRLQIYLWMFPCDSQLVSIRFVFFCSILTLSFPQLILFWHFEFRSSSNAVCVWLFRASSVRVLDGE